MEDVERAVALVDSLERAVLSGGATLIELGRAIQEGLRVAHGPELSPWRRSAAGSWVRTPKIGAPVCMVIGSTAILPAGLVMIWDFESEDAAKAAVDRKLENFFCWSLG